MMRTPIVGDLEASPAACRSTASEEIGPVCTFFRVSDSGVVQSTFSHVTPSSVCHVIIGGSIGGGPAAASAPSGGAKHGLLLDRRPKVTNMGFFLFVWCVSDEVRMWVFEEKLPNGEKLSDAINRTKLPA
ncbi:hypothetical protein QQ045_000887 [Rhodiola kirilowii]